MRKIGRQSPSDRAIRLNFLDRNFLDGQPIRLSDDAAILVIEGGAGWKRRDWPA